MRLRMWVKRQGKGEISRLARVSGLSYPTVHALAHDKQEAKGETALKLSAATGGAVSVAELCTLPKRKRKPKSTLQKLRRRLRRRVRVLPAA